LNTDISQGSVVTQLRCGGIINDDFVANLLLNLPVKEFKNQSIFGKVMVNIIVACFLLTHSLVLLLITITNCNGVLVLFYLLLAMLSKMV